jgi:hypothetical protein
LQVSPSWSKLAGAAVRISIGNSKHIGCINSSGNIYHMSDMTNWTSLDGNASEIACSDDGEMWVVNSSGNIYRRVNGSW